MLIAYLDYNIKLRIKKIKNIKNRGKLIQKIKIQIKTINKSINYYIVEKIHFS
jgi:hypothetical protein